MSACLKLPNLLLMVLLVGCSSSGPADAPDPPQDPLEASAMAALSNGYSSETVAALERSLQHYQALDNLPGQWRLHDQLAKLLIGNDDKAAARNAHAAHRISTYLDSATQQFRSLVLLARIDTEGGYLDEAAGFVTTTGEQAILDAYRGDIDAAWANFDAVTEPYDQAFIFYQQAQSSQDAEMLQLALLRYQRLKDSRGIADCLTSLARLNADNGDKAAATQYAYRAIATLMAGGEPGRAAAVRAWLDTL